MLCLSHFFLYQSDLHSSFVNNVKSFPQICMQNPHNQYGHLHDRGKRKKSLMQVDPRILGKTEFGCRCFLFVLCILISHMHQLADFYLFYILSQFPLISRNKGGMTFLWEL